MPLPPPPKKRSALPPRRLPVSLPTTARVKIVPDQHFGGYVIVTTMGFIVGPRLDRGRGLYPEVQTYAIPTLEGAKLSMLAWDKFMIEQEIKRKK